MTAETKPRHPRDAEDIKRFQANLDDEIDGVAIYRMLADLERDPDRRAIFEELAEVEVKHADVWRNKLREAGVEPREHGPSLRVRFIGWLARRFGVRSVLPIIRNMEAGAVAVYRGQDEAAQALIPDERTHRRTLERMHSEDLGSPTVASRERWHRWSDPSGTFRATVFGMNDGMVANTSLVMGFAGAQADGKFVLLAGVSGLLAGAFSMAAGEYVSMRAQRELFQRQIQLEEQEMEAAPEEERQELALIYEAKGLAKEEAQALAARLMENPQMALKTLAREELGLNPEELGSPWGAATGSFFAFAGGAVVPVIPFLFGASANALAVAISAGLSALALFSAGALLSLLTGRNAISSGLRQTAIGALAAVLTFAIGRLIGVSTGV